MQNIAHAGIAHYAPFAGLYALLCFLWLAVSRVAAALLSLHPSRTTVILFSSLIAGIGLFAALASAGNTLTRRD